ncbi:MAG: hypothetical protein IIC50_18480 [Planctomycetes bacterium]|nr:hypothetical protein [Planctomycetota bacterium]
MSKMKPFVLSVFIMSVLCVLAGSVSADLIEVGTGVNEARVYVEWADGYRVDFLVHFGEGETTMLTGLELMDIVEAETELTTVRSDFGFGVFIDGITYLGHGNVGFGGGDLWWHYWEGNARDNSLWMSSLTGAGGRLVGHGDADGWVYGHGMAPRLEVALPFLDGYGQYAFDANDFATEVVAYEPTSVFLDWLSGGALDDPNTLLGRPTIDTTGDDWLAPIDTPLPVVPVYPAFREFEIIYLGEGGSVTLAFNHPVRDDEHNPYGIDFIVFGNASQNQGGTQGWNNGDPREATVGESHSSEPGVVSVSQDGTIWYSFTTDPNFMADNEDFIKLSPGDGDGPFADTFAPTLGRVYNPADPDGSLGPWNQWWSEPTNPTLPLDPGLSFASFAGKSVARIAETYGDSAGGTGFDIGRLDLPADPDTGKKWFSYVRIDDGAGAGSPEIDAVSDVSAPGDYKHPAPLGDVNGDFCVDIRDAALVAEFWGTDTTDVDVNGDGLVDILDLGLVLDLLGSCTWGSP